VAKGTADDHLWPLIQGKLDVLNKAGLSKDNFFDTGTSVMLVIYCIYALFIQFLSLRIAVKWEIMALADLSNSLHGAESLRS
jgi:hypothetical protein